MAALTTRATVDNAARSRVAGFTLVELMVVVSIVGIIAALAIPGMRQMILTQNVRSAAGDLQSSLYMARSEAIKRAVDVQVVPVSSDWTKGWTVRLTDGTVLRNHSALSDQLSAASGSTMTYRNDGRLSGNSAFNIVFKTSLTTVTARCVAIDLSGRPSVVYDTNGDPSDGCN